MKVIILNNKQQIIRRFEDFYRSQKCTIQIQYILNQGGKTLIFLYEDLQKFESQLTRILRNEPEYTLGLARSALKNVLKGYLRERMTDKDYFVRVTTKDEKCPLKVGFNEFRAKNRNKLLICDGRVIYCARSELTTKEPNYISTQHITLQEIPKNAFCMTHKNKIWVILSGDLVDTVKKREIIRVTGILDIDMDLSKIERNKGFSNYVIKANYISKL